MKNSSKSSTIGVVGVGSFGTAIANMLAEKSEVMVYARKPEVVDEINTQSSAQGKALHASIQGTFDPETLCKECNILFFMVPSSGFQEVARSDKFQVYGNSDIIGVELSGVLKNIIAIASGALAGLGLGENARGLLISRGMVEMAHLSNALGGSLKSVIGLAGIGDLVATCNSVDSRNFTVGYRLAKGESLTEIQASMEEVAEGVNTVKIIKGFLEAADLRAPITENLYRVLFEDLEIEEALQFLMKYPFNVDVDFV